MTMSEQARRCSLGLTKTFFSRSSKSAFSRHDNVRPSSTLFIWLDENVHLSCFGINTSTMTQEHKKHEEVVFTFSSLCATGKVIPACEKGIGKLSPGCLFKAWPCLPQPNGAEFQVLSYLFVPLSRFFVHEWRVLSWVSRYKDNKLLSICRNIISQDDFIARTNVWMDLYKTYLINLIRLYLVGRHG